MSHPKSPSISVTLSCSCITKIMSLNAQEQRKSSNNNWTNVCFFFDARKMMASIIINKVNSKTRFSSEEVVMCNIPLGFTGQTFYSLILTQCEQKWSIDNGSNLKEYIGSNLIKFIPQEYFCFLNLWALPWFRKYCEMAAPLQVCSRKLPLLSEDLMQTSSKLTWCIILIH